MKLTISDPRAFTALAPEWNALLGASASDTIFLTWEWLHTWWKHLSGDRRLAIVALRSGRDLVAVAPLALRPRYLARLRPVDVLEFPGTGLVGSDYLDLFARSGVEQEAAADLAEELSQGRMLIELGQVRKGASLAAAFAEEMRERGWSLTRSPIGVCPYIALGGLSWEGYLESVGPAHRANFRRRLRRLEGRFEVRFEQARTEAERRGAFADLVRLHLARRRALGGSEAFYLPGMVAFHDEFSALALSRGWLRLFVLRLDGAPAAAFYGFRYGRTFSFYQSGFDPAFAAHGVGLVLMGLAIRAAISEGAAEFDFLHGDEAYKFLWAKECRGLVRLRLYPPRAGATLYKGMHDVRRAASAARRALRAGGSGKA